MIRLNLYYMVEIMDNVTPRDGAFLGKEKIEGCKFDLQFHWVPFEKLAELEVYPVQTPQLLQKLDGGVQHLVYRE